jgi:hypothetical protein
LVKKKEEKPQHEYTKRQLSHHRKQQLRQKIILFSGIAVLVAVVALVISGWYFGDYRPYHQTIVKVYDTNLSEADLIDTMKYYYSMYAAYGQTIDLSQQTDYILSSMVQNELLRRGAEQLGISVSDDEIKTSLGDSYDASSKAIRALVRASLLTEKLQSDYFGKQVGDTGSQVRINAMMVESNEIASQIHDQLLSGGNFTALAEQYAVNTSSKNSKGFFDWHPASILKTDLGSSIPGDWAFSDDVKAGDVGNISDNASSKQLGYWLIKVQEKQGSDNATTQALLVSSLEEARQVKKLLEAASDISAIADKYSQYTPSKEKHGNLGVVTASENISTPFNDYVFNAETRTGVWSDPVKDTRFWTTGGHWVIQVVDKSADHPYSETDKDSLVSNAYSEWANGLQTSAVTDINYQFSDAQKQWAIDRVNKDVAKLPATGQ